MNSVARWSAVCVVLGAAVALGSHAVPPEVLTQSQLDGGPIAPGAIAVGNAVWLKASSSSQTCDSATYYWLDLELRQVGVPFTGTPNYDGGVLAGKASCALTPYPGATITGLPSGQYRWQARERTASASTWVPFGDGGIAFVIANGAYAMPSPSPVAFGNVRSGTTSQPVAMDITNLGNVALSVTTAPTISAPFSIQSGPTVPYTVAPNQKVTYQLVVAPPTGPVNGTFSLASNDPQSPTVVALSANGTVPQISLPTSSYGFGQVGINSTPAQVNVAVTNQGQAPLTISSGTVAAPFAVTSLPVIVPSGQTLSVPVTYAPTVEGPNSATLTLNCDDPATPQVQVSLTGTGIAPKLSVTPTTLSFPDTTVGASSAPQTVTLSNPGSGPLTLKAHTITGPFTTQGLMPSQIAQGAQRTFSVQFVPTAPGAITGSVSLPSNDAASPATVSLSGTARAPSLAATPTSHNFGNTDLATQPTVQVTLTNNGDARLDISSFSITGANAGDFSLVGPPGTPTAIAASGGTLSLTVRFAPKDHGARAATLVVASNNYPAGPFTIALSGTGQGSRMVVSPNSLSFGSVNVTSPPATQTFTVQNTGELDLTVTGVTFSGLSGGDYTTPTTFPLTLTPNAPAATITVSFAPTGPGPRSAKATPTSNDVLPSNIDVALLGTGVSPSVQQTPTVLNFGDVRAGTSLARSVTVTNLGNGPLTLSGATITGADAARFTLGSVSFPLLLQPGSGATLPITFGPQALGVVSATLTVASDDPRAPTSTSTLLGNGTSPTMHLSASKLDFGAQLVGRASAPRALDVANAGSGPLHLTGATVSGTGATSYSVVGATTLTVAPGETGRLEVSFNPPTIGESNARLVVTSDDLTTPTAQIDLVGLGVSNVFAASPTTLDFGAFKIGLASPSRSVTLSNLSGDNLTLLNGRLSGAQASDFSFIVDTKSGTIAPGGTATATVSFKPAVAGASNAKLSFVTTDTTVPPVEVQLTGQGISQVLDVQPLTIDFGAVAAGESGSPQTVTVTNRAGSTLTFAAPSSSNPAFVVDATGFGPLAAGAQGQLMVTFAPTEVGPVEGQLALTLQGQSTPELQILLTGAGSNGPPSKPCGCSSAGAPVLALAGLVAAALRRRRR